MGKLGKSDSVLDFYVGLVVVYTLSEDLMSSGIIVTISRWSLFFISLFFYFRVMLTKAQKPLIIWALGLLYLMFFVYGSFPIIEGKDFYAWRSDNRRIRSFLYILQISVSILPIFVFYYYAKLGILTKKYIQNKAVPFLFVVIISYFVNLQDSLMESGKEEVTNNSGYLILSIFPMLVLLKARSIKQYVLMGICVLLIFFAMKRGAILILLFCLIIYFWFLLFKSKSSKRFGVIIALFVAIVSVYFIYTSLLNSSDYFQTRLEKTMDGDSGGRDVIFEFFYSYFINEMSTKDLLFGLGANATLDIFGQYAHNDWLEIAINQGCIGLAIYLFYWIVFMKLCRKECDDSQVKAALLMLFVIYFFKTFFSMSYREYTLYSSLVFGYCIAMIYANNSVFAKLNKKYKLKNN